MFSLIPCLGFLLGPVALVLGILGLKAIKKDEKLPGKGHAWSGIIIGGIVLAAHLVLTILILINLKHTS